MSKLAVRMPRAEAHAVALDVIGRLEGTYERIEIAGSWRRGSSTVGDLELVAVPKMEATHDVWGNQNGEASLVREGLTRGLGEGWLSRPDKPAEGDRYGRFVHTATGIQLDVFSCLPPAQWGMLLLIRTGPDLWSRWLVTEARRRGFHVARGALRAGNGWHGNPDTCECVAIDTPEERDVFTALGLPYESPERRGLL